VTVLRVSSLGKAYRTYRSEWQRLARWINIPVTPAETNWVLRHVNLAVSPGEAVGIVGQNGAGKSTLLKLITGTSVPSEGEVSISGRVSAILELGMGFNPELTARQNVRHAAGLLGLTAERIETLLPDIEAFCEIDRYFDAPMRTYSSGMQMRVAFALATAERPDLLIVDEALSVGDAYFQHKSFDRIREFRAAGTSLLIVSHDKSAIQSLCDRALLLEKGAVIKDGDPETVFNFYNAIIAEREDTSIESRELGSGKSQLRSGTGEATVTGIELLDSAGRPVEFIEVGNIIQLRIDVEVHCDLDTLVLGYGIRDRLGQTMFGTNTWHTKQIVEQPKAGNRLRYTIEFPANFGIGSYSIQTALVDRDTHLTANYEWRDRALMFNVINNTKSVFEGSLWVPPQIVIEHNHDPATTEAALTAD